MKGPHEGDLTSPHDEPESIIPDSDAEVVVPSKFLEVRNLLESLGLLDGFDSLLDSVGGGRGARHFHWASETGDPFDMEDGLKFTVVGPLLPELKKLHEKHQEWLKELAKGGKTPEEVLSAYIDKSVPNLSSIVVLAEAGEKKMLLTGDARGDKILEGLELMGLMEEGGTMHVDLLKVPHHGSANNLDNDFFERIHCRPLRILRRR